MPQLPRYDSQGKLYGDQPEAIQTGATKNLEAVGKTLGVMEDVAVKWKNAMDTMQSTVVKATMEESMALRMAEAAKDTDINGEDRMIKQLEQDKETAMKGVKDPLLQKKLGFEIDHANNLAAIKLRNIYGKKKIAVGEEAAYRRIDTQVNNIVYAENDEQRLAAKQQIEAIVDEQIAGGIFALGDKDKIVNKAVKDAEEIIKDKAALKRVQDKQILEAQKLAVNENEKNYVRMKINGKDKLGGDVTREDLLSMVKKDMDAGLVSPEFADSYIKSLKSPKAVRAKGVDKNFSEIMEKINKGIVSFDRIRTDILNRRSSGALSEEDEENLTTYLELLDQKGIEDFAKFETRNAWFGLGGPIYIEDDKLREASRRRMSIDFIDKLKNGIDPQTAVLEATRKETLSLQPSAVNYPEGMEVMTSKGVLKKIMPNGDIVNVESKQKPKESPKEKK